MRHTEGEPGVEVSVLGNPRHLEGARPGPHMERG